MSLRCRPPSLLAEILGAVALVATAIALAPHDAPTAHAYIGPGAGIALLGSFFAVLSGVISGLLFFLTYPIRLVWRTMRSRRASRRALVKRVVILGLDGLEPTLTEQWLDEGRLPNLAKLRAEGGYARLGTTTPPLSPVAWSSFTTGSNPGKHHIFDFIGRDPRTYRPTQSSVEIRGGKRTLTLGPWRLPLSRPKITSLRKSKPFWTVLGEAGIFSAILRVPITYPPDKFRGVQLSAMCVPDLRGTHGMFSYYTESGPEGHTTDGEVGGDVIRVERAGTVVRSFVRGPENSLRTDRRELRAPFEVRPARDGAYALRIDGRTIALEPGVTTDWVHVRFRTIGPLRAKGLCRFMLKSFEPFEMYCTPVHVDPERPVVPISHPMPYARYLAGLLGPYATLGLAEDTWALSESRIDEDAFLAQAYDVHAERESMYFDALERVRRGVVACVFDAPDRIQHMFWRFIDDGHPALSNGHANGSRAKHERVIREMYERMDGLVGRTMDALRPGDALFVMSDHGFKPFRRGVDLNAWLRDEGYLVLKDGASVPSATYLGDIDWSRTKAYALGLAGIYLNVEGRERDGIVAKGDADDLRLAIADKLTGLVDPGTGQVAIHEAIPRDRAYAGPYVGDAPDVVIGYAVGARVSWDAAIGRCGADVFSDNTKAWSGDHCIHPDLVPGVLFANRPLPDAPRITDLGPTTLDLFGVPVPSYMDGESLLCRDD